MTAGLTLLPALLTICGRRGFWPRRHLVEPAEDGGERARGRLAARRRARPAPPGRRARGHGRRCSAIGGLGLLAYQEDYSVEDFFKEPTESADGFTVMQQAFPAGALVPTTVLVERLDGEVTAADVAAVRGVAWPSPAWSRSSAVGRSTDGRVAR